MLLAMQPKLAEMTLALAERKSPMGDQLSTSIVTENKTAKGGRWR